MPSTFPFLKLPILVQLLIIQKLNLCQLFDFSLISRKSREIAKSLELKIEKLVWKFDDRFKSHQLDLINGLSAFHVQIPTQSYYQQTPFGDNKSLSLARVHYNDVSGFWIIRGSGSTDKSLLDISRYLLEIVRADKLEFEGDNVKDLVGCPVWKVTRSVDSLMLINHSTTGVLSSRDLIFALTNLSVNQFSLFCEVERGFKYTGPLRMKTLTTTYPDFLTLQCLLNMECKQVFFTRGSRLTASDKNLNTILKHWIAGRGLKNLEKIHIDMPDGCDFRMQRILEGVQTFPWDPKNRSECWEGEETNLSDGRDMRRGSDGKLATAVMKDCVAFRFYVWN